MRCLIISHGHAELSSGGGERAAFALFDHLRRTPGFQPLLAARAEPEQIGHGAPFRTMLGRPDELLVSPPPVDPYTLLSRDPRRLGQILDEIIRLHEPKVAHVQHFAFWGIDILHELRKRGIRVILTLHEFLLMCHRDGQMLTTKGKLCSNAAPIACASCFPGLSAGEFFVRKQILLRHLSAVDCIISPSAFLAQRFVDWGLDARKIHVVENPLAESQLAEALATPLPGDDADTFHDDRLRLGYFGQVTPYKGLTVLLKAIEALDKADRERIGLSVHGVMTPGLPAEIRSEIEQSLRRLRGIVEWRGAYEGHETLGLMRDVDWVVVPSIWWENSPLVLQEARLAARPVLVSDIGGMREKAAQIPGSLTFRPGSAQDLARILKAQLGHAGARRLSAAAVAERRDGAVKAHRDALGELIGLVDRSRHAPAGR